MSCGNGRGNSNWRINPVLNGGLCYWRITSLIGGGFLLSLKYQLSGDGESAQYWGGDHLGEELAPGWVEDKASLVEDQVSIMWDQPVGGLAPDWVQAPASLLGD